MGLVMLGGMMDAAGEYDSPLLMQGGYEHTARNTRTRLSGGEAFLRERDMSFAQPHEWLQLAQLNDRRSQDEAVAPSGNAMLDAILSLSELGAVTTRLLRHRAGVDARMSIKYALTAKVLYKSVDVKKGRVQIEVIHHRTKYAHAGADAAHFKHTFELQAAKILETIENYTRGHSGKQFVALLTLTLQTD
jgi:hypothetical protein